MITSSSTDLAALDQERRAAITENGWGARFTFFQPRNLAFWVWLVFVIWGTWHNLLSTIAASYYAPAIGLAFVVFTVYGAVFWWFTQHIDRYSSQPALLRVMAFLWGGFAATFAIAAPANDALLSIYAKLFGQPFAMDWGPALAAPFTEEWGKGLGILLLIALAPGVMRTAYDGFVAGAFLGLGFQILEDVLYVAQSAPTQFGANQIGASLGTFGVRMASGIGSHILFSAIFCTGLVYAIGLPSQPRRLGRGIGLIVLAMVLHGVWDGQSAIVASLFSGGAAIAMIIVLMCCLPLIGVAIVVRVFGMAVAGERASIRPILAPEVASGVLTQAEVDAAAGDHKARRRYRKDGHGPGHRHRNRHVLEAVFDLAHELGRSGGDSDDRVEFARAEVLRLRQADDPARQG
ncbi:PrsW family glutamic-type intramembrane protease [Nocardioides sp. NPDC059952]|uniref:PrsW family glutamic-type intramembrane protease n=1 Tax=Nocardioides sp. NPDC059952 TaxID=3347014 RepID=UPI003653DBB8